MNSLNNYGISSVSILCNMSFDMVQHNPLSDKRMVHTKYHG